MADWIYEPVRDPHPTIERVLPEVLVNHRADGSLVIRERYAKLYRIIQEFYQLSGDDTEAAEAFLDARGYVTPFTKFDFDASAGTWGVSEITVRLREGTSYRFEQFAPFHATKRCFQALLTFIASS